MDALKALFDTSFLNNAEGYDFRKLPAELRNRIYECVVIEDGPIRLNQRNRRPGITQVCKNTRQDSLPIYLGRNSFRFTVANFDYAILAEWIDLLSVQDVRGIRDISILCAGRVLHRNSSRYIPSFTQWSDLVVKFYHGAFTSAQIKWEVKYRTAIRPNYNRTAWIEESDSVPDGRRKVAFARYVLTPLLKANKLFDPDNPPRETQIVQLPNNIDSIDFIPNVKAPQPNLDHMLYVSRHPLEPRSNIISPMSPIYWYDRYVEDLKKDWARRHEAIQLANQTLRSWTSQFSHMIQEDPYASQGFYDRYLSQVQRLRQHDPDWQAMLRAEKEVEKRRSDLVFLGKAQIVADEEDYEIAEYEASDFGDAKEEESTIVDDDDGADESEGDDELEVGPAGHEIVEGQDDESTDHGS